MLAQNYMKIIVFGFSGCVIMTVATAAFQGYGDTKTPMMVAAAMNLVNIIFGFGLIFGFGPLKGMGIFGAATALVLAQTFGAGMDLFLLYRKKKKGLFFGTVPQKMVLY